MGKQNIIKKHALEAIFHKIKRRVHKFAGERPFLYYTFAPLVTRPKIRKLLVKQKTQLIIAGFPRSANTFATVAFQQANQDVRVAHHLHVPAQVILADRYHIPCLVLIRKPADAVLSLIVRHPEIPPDQAFKDYIWFYKTIFKYSHAYVVGLFEDVIKDYGPIIERINAKFGTQFSAFTHTKDNVRSVFARIEKINRKVGKGLEKQVARPSSARKHLKNIAKNTLEIREIKSLIAIAEVVYHDFKNHSGG